MHEAHGHGACQLRLAKDRVDSSPLSVDRKSTRLNSSHGYISYAVFCLKKKNMRKDMHIFLWRYLSGEATAKEKSAVKQWMQASQENEANFTATEQFCNRYGAAGTVVLH